MNHLLFHIVFLSYQKILLNFSLLVRIDAWGQELDNALHGTIASTLHNPEHEDIDVLLQELQTQAQVMIEDKVDALNPWDMQDLIDGLLQALGYSTKVADDGINLLAFKDTLGTSSSPIL